MGTIKGVRSNDNGKGCGIIRRRFAQGLRALFHAIRVHRPCESSYREEWRSIAPCGLLAQPVTEHRSIATIHASRTVGVSVAIGLGASRNIDKFYYVSACPRARRYKCPSYDSLRICSEAMLQESLW